MSGACWAASISKFPYSFGAPARSRARTAARPTRSQGPALPSQSNTRSRSSKSFLTSVATVSLKPSTTRTAGSPRSARSGSNSSPKIFPVASTSPNMAAYFASSTTRMASSRVPAIGPPFRFRCPLPTPRCRARVSSNCPQPGRSARRKLQPVPLAVQVADLEGGAARPQERAQTMDHPADVVGTHERAPGPDETRELDRGDRLAGARGEGQHRRHLPGREMDRQPVPGNQEARAVDLDVVEPHGRRRRRHAGHRPWGEPHCDVVMSEDLGTALLHGGVLM